MGEKGKSSSYMVDPVTILSKNYDSDLRILRNLRPVSITPLELEMLRSMLIKYCKSENENLCQMMKYRDIDFKRKFFSIKGELEAEIQQRLEKLAITDYLESMRDHTPSKRPRQPNPKMGIVSKEVDE